MLTFGKRPWNRADGETYKFHLLPSGMLHDGCMNVIGNGCVVDMEGVFEDMNPEDKGEFPEMRKAVKRKNRSKSFGAIFTEIDSTIHKNVITENI